MQVFMVMREDGRPVRDSLFIKDGFSWLTFFLAPFWMIWHQLWLPLGLYVLAVAGASLLMLAGFSGATVFWLVLAIHILVALESGEMRRAAMAGHGHSLIALIAGDEVEDAELRFFGDLEATARSDTKGARVL